MIRKFENLADALAFGGPFVSYWIGDDQFFCAGTFDDVVSTLPHETTFVLYGEWVLFGNKYHFDFNDEVPEFCTPVTQERAHYRAKDFYAPFVETEWESRTIAGEMGLVYEEYMGIDVRFDDDF
jgi:hypothetical protein